MPASHEDTREKRGRTSNDAVGSGSGGGGGERLLRLMKEMPQEKLQELILAMEALVAEEVSDEPQKEWKLPEGYMGYLTVPSALEKIEGLKRRGSDRLLSSSEAAELLGLHQYAVSRAAHFGMLPIAAIGTGPGGGETGQYLFREGDIMRYRPYAKRIQYLADRAYNFKRHADTPIIHLMVPIDVAVEYLRLRAEMGDPVNVGSQIEPLHVYTYARDNEIPLREYRGMIFLHLRRLLKSLGLLGGVSSPELDDIDIPPSVVLDTEKFEDLMQEKGVSRRLLSKLSGVAPATIRKALAGNRIGQRKARELLRALGEEEKIKEYVKSY